MQRAKSSTLTLVLWVCLLAAMLMGAWSLAGTGQAVAAQTESGWSTPTNLSQSDTASYYPDIAVDSAGHVYVVWGEFSPEHEGRGRPNMLMLRVWDGQSWSPTSDIVVGGHLPQIAVDSQGRLHVVRIVTRRIDNELTYTRAWAQDSPLNAQTWTPNRQIAAGGAYWPDMIVDGQDRIHLVFSGDGGVNYIRSTDGGDVWSDPIVLSASWDSPGAPRLAVDASDNLYAVWPNTNGAQPVAHSVSITLRYSTDGGESWSEPSQVMLDSYGIGQVDAAVDSMGTFHLIWRYEAMSSTGTVAYVNSSNRGQSWSPVEILPVFSGAAYSFGLAVDSADNLHLVIPSGKAVMHLIRPWGGGWLAPALIAENPCNEASADAELVISQGNHLYAVWYDRQECQLGWVEPSGRGEVFLGDFTSEAPDIMPQPLPPVPTLTATTATGRVTASSQVTPSVIAGLTVTPTTTAGLDTELPMSTPASGLVVGISATVLIMAVMAGVIVGLKRR